jgi:hypothetical protein
MLTGGTKHHIINGIRLIIVHELTKNINDKTKKAIKETNNETCKITDCFVVYRDIGGLHGATEENGSKYIWR